MKLVVVYIIKELCESKSQRLFYKFYHSHPPAFLHLEFWRDFITSDSGNTGMSIRNCIL